MRVRSVIPFTFALIAVLLPGLSAQEHTRSYPAKAGVRVVVSVDSSDITLQTWSRLEVVVRSPGLDDGAFSVRETGNTIQIRSRHDRGRWSRNSRIEISLPENCHVDLRTTSGDIRIRGKVIGSIDATTSGGDVRIGDVEGPAYAKTSGGHVEAGFITGDADLKTSGGDITVRDVIGNLDVSTSGGQVQIGDVTGRLEARSSGGDIDIGKVGADVYLNTSGGNLTLRDVAGEATLRTSGGDIELSGSAGATSARTAGGDIELRDVRGSVDARTAGGEIEVGLTPDPTGESNLITKGGGIELILPATARATVEATIRLQGRWGRDDHDDDYDIVSDFGPESHEKLRSAREIRAVYRINGGGQRIVLRTTNGDIHIRKSRLE